MPRRIAGPFVLCAVVLAACSGTSDESPTSSISAPTYAFSDYLTQADEAPLVVVSGQKRSTMVGTPTGFLPDGSLLVDIYPEGDAPATKPPFIFDPRSGRSYPAPDVNDAAYEVRGVGTRSLPDVRLDPSRAATFREYDPHFKLIRQLALPVSKVTSDEDGGTGYGQPVSAGDVTFIPRTERDGVDSTGDSVTRLTKDGTLSTILANKHISHLTLASDGRSILASVDTASPFYEGAPESTSVVELDADSGKIRKSYGLPSSCRTYKPASDYLSCLVRMDKVDGVVAVAINQTRASGGETVDEQSTWVHRDGAWSEVRSQRGKDVHWQSSSDRIEQVLRLTFDGTEVEAPIEWISTKGRRTLGGTKGLSIRDVLIPGSLIRPEA